MTTLYFSILISFGTAVTDPSYGEISPDSDPLPTLTFATSPPDTSTARSHKQSAMCFDIFSIADPQTCLQQRLERWPRRALALLPAPLPCTKIRRTVTKFLRDASHFSLSAYVHKSHRGGQVAPILSDPPSHSDLAQRKFAFCWILGSAEPSTVKLVI